MHKSISPEQNWFRNEVIVRGVVETCLLKGMIIRMNLQPSWRIYVVFLPEVVVRLTGKFEPDYLILNLSDISINITGLRKVFLSRKIASTPLGM